MGKHRELLGVHCAEQCAPGVHCTARGGAHARRCACMGRLCVEAQRGMVHPLAVCTLPLGIEQPHCTALLAPQPDEGGLVLRTAAFQHWQSTPKQGEALCMR